MNLKELIATTPNIVEVVDAELRKLMTEQPDFRYVTRGSDKKIGVCNYNKGAAEFCGPECNGCIFGQALQNLGVPRDCEDLSKQTAVRRLFAYNGPSDIDLYPQYWTEIQGSQDSGTRWGDLLHYLPVVV